MRKLILFVTLCGLVASGTALGVNWVVQPADPAHWPYADGPLIETAPARNSGYRGAGVVANGQIHWVGYITLTTVYKFEPGVGANYPGNRQSGFDIFTPTAAPVFGTTYGGMWNSAFGGDDIDNNDGTWTSVGLTGYNNGNGTDSPLVSQGTGYTMDQGFAYEGNIYVFGGYPTWGGGMAKYDTGANSWAIVDTVGDNDGLYMDGGGLIGSHWYKVHRAGALMDFDASSDTFGADIAIAGLLDPKFGAASAVVDSKLYIVDTWEAVTPGVVYEINPGAATVVEKATAPIPVSQASSIVCDGLIYILGGRTAGAGSSAIDNIQIYNPATDTWFLSPDKIPDKRSGQLTEVLEGRIYLGQGYYDYGGGDSGVKHDFWYANWDDIIVPEPGTMMMLGSGLLGLLAFLKRKK